MCVVLAAMKARRPLVLDLNNLFKPAIEDGLNAVLAFDKAFRRIHDGVKVLKQTGQLPFSRLPSDDVLRQEIMAAAGRYEGVDNVIVCGIGGSALGAVSMYHALAGPFGNLLRSTRPKKRARLFVVDHIDPASIMDLFDLVAPQKNLFVFVSKSGNTAETLAQYLFVKKNFAGLSPDNTFVITGAEDGFLRELAGKEGYPTLPVPSGVGGRFSVFSAVGLFPLAVCGFDIAEILDGAAHAEALCQHDVLAQNPAALLAFTVNAWLKKRGFSQVVLMPYSDRLRLFPDWFAQLWAESLGKKKTLSGKKESVGTTPIKSVGVTDQHSQLQLYLDGPRDKVILFIEVEETWATGQLCDDKFGNDRVDFLAGRSLKDLMRNEKLATEESLRENGRPNATIRLSMINEFQLGQLYQVFMNVIPYMGALLDINAFDQPAVERIKKFTFGLMGRKGFEDFKLKFEGREKRKDLVF